MTFRDYITLDGLKFKTPQKAWRPVDNNPSTLRRTLAGDADATFGPAAFFTWEGEIEAPPVASVGWGTYADLKA
ncbi:MAG TPA: hypothetical protein VFF68_10765, partial [Anaerolineaceae bacterium]|nr:hypothetical protein [Anaerolineaceae bacterium]